MPDLTDLTDGAPILATDTIAIIRAGVLYGVTFEELAASLQQVITLAPGALLANFGTEAGPPSSVVVGDGLGLGQTIVANGTDHLAFPVLGTFDVNAKVVVNSGGEPQLMNVLDLMNSGFVVLNLSGLPTSPVGLAAGQPWNNGGALSVA